MKNNQIIFVDEFDEINHNFAKRFSLLRKRADITQFDLSIEIDYSVSSVSRWEEGKYLKKLLKLARLEEILGVSLFEIFTGEKLQDNKDNKQ